MSFPFKAVLFDWSYTLVNLIHEDDAAAFRKLIDFLRKKELQVPVLETFFETYREMFQNMIKISRQTHREACFEHVLKYFLLLWKINLDGKTTVEELLTVYYKEIFAPRILYPDVLPGLNSLKANGVRMGIISNTTNPGFIKDRERVSMGLDSFFEFSIYSSEVPYRKPHPSIFKLAIKRLNLSPADILFVGDTPETDVAGPQAVGIAAAWINRRKTELTDSIHPDFEIHSLMDLMNISTHVSEK